MIARSYGFSRSKRALWAAVALCVWLVAGVAAAQTGVSDDRVSLPEGPGSLEGIGENVDVDGNMGTMRHRVQVEVPQGFAGVTPALSLNYSSGAGGSVVGMGWTLDTPYIERMTYRGLPRYVRGDDFAADGGQQLVALPGTNPPVYRARYEGGFVRYTWLEAGDGAEGYWLAEYPDGRKGYFGAGADGVMVPSARVSGPDGTFRYMLVEMVDVHGHQMRMRYRKDGAASLIEEIGYVFVSGDSPRYAVRFAYEPRQDETGEDQLSDAKGGFDERLTQRMASISVYSGAERIRQYRMGYERYADSGGFTRLASVETVGLEGEVYPLRWSFTYSRALGGSCNGEDCARPFTVSMGSLGVDISTGRATLIDINGDALPDVVDTSEDGPHRFFVNVMSPDGTNRFAPQPIQSQIGTRGGHPLDSGYVQVLDLNGDGFTDMINAQTGQALLNRGQGDWEPLMAQQSNGQLPDFGDDFDGDDLQTIRFFDYDNDKRIDVIQSNQVNTTIYRNQGAQAGFVVDDGVSAIGAGFVEDRLQTADMNGDGLLDMVKLAPGQLNYRLNYGWGQWGPWVDVLGLPIGPDEVTLASLEDLNGDALADLVVVLGTQVKYAINRNGRDFQASTTLGGADVDGQIPQRDESVSVLYADMNGNGSTDVVWINASGNVTFLELFPVRPNQLSRIENNLGLVREVSYSTSVLQMARDAQPWAHKLPHPMLVVERVDEFDLLTNVHDVTVWSYRDGFYDGVEKQFRGYAGVQAQLLGDDSQEEGLTRYTFDVGAQDTYRKGLRLRQELSSAGRSLRVDEDTYEDCPLAEIPEGTELPIRYLCLTSARQTLREGADPTQHATTERRSTYDGYGNVTLSTELGVTQLGGGACAPCDRDAAEFGRPCGQTCQGDERITETAFVPPSNTGGRWMLNQPWRERRYGRPGDALATERLTYYDGEPFEGLPAGNLTRGLASRVTERVNIGSQDVIQTTRSRHDRHGNVIETLDPNGDPARHAHRRQYTLDEEGLRVVQTDILLEDTNGDPYVLRRETQYEPVFDRPVESTSWMRVVNGQILSARRSTFYTYDQFARPTARVLPGQDSAQSPSEAYEYLLGNPSSRIIVRKRSVTGGALDQEVVRCVDGRGRTYQERTRLEGDTYQVSGFSIFNVKGEPREVFQPYLGQGAACDAAPPSGVRSVKTRRDALRRVIAQEQPDGDLYDGASVVSTRYEPLATLTFDGEDNDTASPHAQTPLVRRVDGLGRVTSLERALAPGDAPAVTTLRYDGMGNLIAVIDAEGNRKDQRFDLLGRVTELLDPNKEGGTRYTYDAAGNVVSSVDGRGVTVVTRYDGANRPLHRFEEGREADTLIAWTYDFADDCDPVQCTFTEGRLAQVSWPGLNGGRDMDIAGYDVRGRTVLHTRVLGGVSFSHTNTYDNSDRLTETLYPDGQRVRREYDDASRLAAIPALLPSIRYDERGLMAEVDFADGTREQRGYDARQRLRELMTLSPGGDLLQGFGYARDRADNLLEVEDLTAPAPRAPRYDARYSYDAWYRLTEADLTLAQGPEQLTYDFDLIDNVLAAESSRGAQSPAHQGAFGYESAAPNALTSANGIAREYDAEGQLTARGELSLRWDFLRRMDLAMRDGEEVGRFFYGPDQRRVARHEGASRTLYTSPDFELRDGISALYVRVDRQRMVRLQSAALATSVLPDLIEDDQINAADAWTAHARAEGLIEGADEHGDEVDALLMSSVRRALLESGEPEVFLHADHQGSITMATAGEVLGQRAFYPTGLEREDAWGHVDAYGFTGQEQDASTGLLHFDFRYLDPATGRWISVDPLFSTSTAENILQWGESTTAYAYVGNRFPNVVDPTGLQGSNCPQQPAQQPAQQRSQSSPNAQPRQQQRQQQRQAQSSSHVSVGVNVFDQQVSVDSHGEVSANLSAPVTAGIGAQGGVSSNGDVRVLVNTGASVLGTGVTGATGTISHSDGTTSTVQQGRVSAHLGVVHASVSTETVTHPDGSSTSTQNVHVGVFGFDFGYSTSTTTPAPDQQ